MNNVPKHFLEAESTIKEVSYDDKNDVYMSQSQLKVYNFDKITRWYAARLNNSETGNGIKSNDALFCDGEHFVFIEFKNGKIGNGVKKELRIKALDSFIVLCDSKIEASKLISGFRGDVNYTRENVDYILVYNELKNPPSDSNKDKVRDSVNQKANNPRFSLAYLKGYLFNKVFTYTEDEFERCFVAVHAQ